MRLLYQSHVSADDDEEEKSLSSDSSQPAGPRDAASSDDEERLVDTGKSPLGALEGTSAARSSFSGLILVLENTQTMKPFMLMVNPLLVHVS